MESQRGPDAEASRLAGRSGLDPRRPKRDPKDDDAPGLPALDGEGEGGTALETGADLDVSDDEPSALDDHAASDLEGALEGVAAEEPSIVGKDDEAAPLPIEADPSLAAGESERWTEGSDASEDTPWQEAPIAESTESSVDRGEEGFDDLGAPAGDALPGLPPARAGEAGDDDADELDLRDAGTLDAVHASDETAVPALPRAALQIRWHGPEREAVRALALDAVGVLAGAHGLFRIVAGQSPERLAFEGDVSALLARPEAIWIADDAGSVFRLEGASLVKHARPGTDDASLGGLELFAVGEVVVARTRGGALFRTSGDGWIGPVVAKNVRRARQGHGPEAWLTLVVGSASSPELLATRDARTFERLRGLEGELAAEASRSGDVVAVATASGRLFVSRDAGVSYAPVAGVVDVERVWARDDGVVLSTTFHEATDHGRLVRVRDGRAEVLLDVEAEVATRRLSGPGEQDGDGRIHALVAVGSTLWAATGVGVFELVLEAGADEPAP